MLVEMQSKTLQPKLENYYIGSATPIHQHAKSFRTIQHTKEHCMIVATARNVPKAQQTLTIQVLVHGYEAAAQLHRWLLPQVP